MLYLSPLFLVKVSQENTAYQDWGKSVWALGSYAGGIPVFGKTCGAAPILRMAFEKCIA